MGRRECLGEAAHAKALGEVATASGCEALCVAGGRAADWDHTTKVLTCHRRPPSWAEATQIYSTHSMAFGLVGGIEVTDSPNSKDPECGINSVFKDTEWAGFQSY